MGKIRYVAEDSKWLHEHASTTQAHKLFIVLVREYKSK